MYGRRLKILLAICACIALLCIARLGQMQLLSSSWYRARIDELQRNTVKRLPSTRGSILDRKGRILAADELSFDLCMTYQLTSALDERTIRPGRRAAQQAQENLARLEHVIEKCSQIFGVEANDILTAIRARNERIWSMRMFQAWRNAYPDSELLQRSDPSAISFSEAMADFEREVPDAAQRADLARRVELAEMNENWPFLAL
ncbi:MAG TPA: hypothetical protein VLH60_02430, partial [Sedimentisphaerales bacterium]|nr:hypothetical protein [Sedimentisphaerales bacterium]